MIDTAADPLAGLERMNPYEVMSSKRYHKRPASQMFRELFRYIQGENQEKEKVEMTSPVVVFHKVTKETTIGDYEEVEMCFYLPHKYQEYHEHLENQRHHDRHHELNENHEHNENREHPEDHVHQDNTRHTENHEHNDGHEHPEEHEHLEDDLLGKKYNNKEYFTASYDNPWKLGNKRNEVWIKCLEPVQTLPGELLENQARRGITKHSKL